MSLRPAGPVGCFTNNRHILIVPFSLRCRHLSGRTSFVTALLRQRVSPLCHSVVRRPGTGLGPGERKVRARRGETGIPGDGGCGGDDGDGDGTSVSFLCNRSTLIFHRTVVTRHR